MKRTSILFLMFLSFSAFSATVQLLPNSGSVFTQTNEGKDLNLKFHISNVQSTSSFFSENNLVFHDFTHTELPNTMEPGYASVPFKSIILEGKPESIKVEITKGQAFEITGRPSPAPEKPCRCEKDDLDWKYYRKSIKTYKPYQLEYLGDYRGQELTRLTLFPFQVESDKVIAYPQMQATIKSGKVAKLQTSSSEASPTLLIITPSRWETEWSEFMAYKNARGIQTELVVYDRVAENKEDLQAFLSERFAMKAFEYVIIAGNRNIIPTFLTDTRFDSQTPTDLPYFVFGEKEEDFIPDVLYGRFVIESAVELQNYFQKIYQYENQLQGPWVEKPALLGIASNEGAAPSDKEYLEQMQNPLKESFNLPIRAFQESDADSTPKNINAVLNAGTYWMNYIGHGDGFNWPSMSTDYNVGDIDELLNFKIKPVIIDVACQNGRLEGEGTLGERFLTATRQQRQTGAVAYYGGSVNISWDPPAIMAIGISKSLKENDDVSLGSHLLNGQIYLLENYSAKEAVVENFVWYHLFGDPSLSINLKH